MALTTGTTTAMAIVKNSFIDIVAKAGAQPGRRCAGSAPPPLNRHRAAGGPAGLDRAAAAVDGARREAELAAAQLTRLTMVVQGEAKPETLSTKPLATLTTNLPAIAASTMTTITPSGSLLAFSPRFCSTEQRAMSDVEEEATATAAAKEGAPAADASSAGSIGDAAGNIVSSQAGEAPRGQGCRAARRDRVKRAMEEIERKIRIDPELLSSGRLRLPKVFDRNHLARAAVVARLSQVAAEAHFINHARPCIESLSPR